MVTELNDISKNIYKLESKNPTVGVLVYMSPGNSSSSSLEFLLLLDSLRFLLPEGFAAPVFGSASSLDCLAPCFAGQLKNDSVSVCRSYYRSDKKFDLHFFVSSGDPLEPASSSYGRMLQETDCIGKIKKKAKF